MQDMTVSEVLELAIDREQAAVLFYGDINSKTEDPSIRDALAWIIAEEKKHKAFLVAYREGRQTDRAPLSMRAPVNYKIAEYLEEPESDKGMNAAAVFLIASHRELRSYQFYTELARLHPQGEIREILLQIANEELAHKEKMEYLYSNTAFPQTAGG